ncbi:peptide chain release factor N(5)-glutamine methyltransferase [Prolixibacter denitrificans]|uniref:Release factor glutamine methyltransferase n=1 Tax=Prolixibacter denitrificans TaxID=1541063 RepID=A0A2P8CKV6_9BACT|nr:peptide chain release factor N(5)-glutamine methyltransferase [Prolixibacter denitrificans]PSK85606.1 release factor glutamine methyltransferase [Prolixibacter denitrificans]GET20226.1 release factor glutamine methyltransferase [Prolixibacter denitrificans]
MKRLIDDIREKLSSRYEPAESESISFLIFEHVLGYSRLQVHLKKDETIPDAKVTEIEEILNRLVDGEPIQYILGKADFYSLTFFVNPQVLIPRQETEELVDWIIKDNKLPTPKILDIGTGSGCIPVSLAKNITGAQVFAYDISAEALKVANQNAMSNHVDVRTQKVDILQWKAASVDKTFDIIVSNPPYVKDEEKSLMLDHVVSHEPHLALFVSNDDSLIFYRRIAEFAQQHLSPEGKLYFEINEALGKQTASLLREKGFPNLTLRKDINGKDRMICATR